MSFNKTVIDISKYQGVIDFKKMKEAGNIFGVIIRCGYRGYGNGQIVTDPYFQRNVDGCIENDIPYGVYFFSQAVNASEAIEEADYCLNAVKKQKVQPLFPIYIDTEWSNTKHNGRADKITDATRTFVVRNFCKRVEENGYFAGIYASTSWFRDQLLDNTLKEFSHWVAHYSNKCGYTDKHHMWQYSSGGSVAGVPGRVDMNHCYIDFPNVIKSAGLNGYKKEEIILHTIETTRAVSEHALGKFQSLAKVLGVDLEVTTESRHYIKTEPITEGDIKQFESLAKGLFEEVTIKEVKI